MSLNIKTSTGLLEIGGSVTKEKVISALGYSPANEEVETTVDNHINDSDIHIASDERTLWNKNVENLNSHKSDTTIHVTSAEKQAWNNKSDFSGAYADLIDAPSITETESGNMVIADESGNIIMQVDADGLETTTVTAKSAVINGVNVTTKLDEHKESIDDVSESLSVHTSDSVAHITSDERILWNNKSDFSGDYNDLKNAPDIVEDNSGEVVYADESGNVILKIGEAGLETTQVIAGTVVVNGTNIGSALSAHTGNSDIHITADERVAWNAKADTTYVDNKVASLVNSAPEALNTLDELSAALGDDANFATTVTNSIASKANQTALDSHTSNKSNPHNVTKAQVGLGNVDNTSDANKPVSTAQQAALDNLKSELSESIVSEAEQWTVADNSGNIIAKVDSNGLETTTVTAKNVVVNGTDIETTLAGKSDVGHAHTVANITDLTATATELNYMDGAKSNVQTQLDTLTSAVSGKAASSHTHDDRYYTETEVDTKIAAVNTSIAAVNTSITNITNGTTVVKKSEHAVTADSADSATQLSAAKTISLTGDASGSVAFDGTKDVSIAVTVADDSHTHDNRYYTETEIDTKLSGKSDTGHTHTIANITNLQSSLDSKASKAYVDELFGGLSGGTDATAVQVALDTHISNKSNPHGVTLSQLGVSASATELNYVDGVTSNIQTQLNAKAASSDLGSYYTKTQIDNMSFITVEDIDTICGTTT